MTNSYHKNKMYLHISTVQSLIPKKGGVFIYEKMLKHREMLKTKLDKIKNQFANLPQGKLIISKSKGYVRFFESDGHNKTYLKKGDQKTIQKLVYKKLLLLQIEDISQEMEAIDLYLDKYPKEKLSEQFLLENPEIQPFLYSLYKPQKQKLDEWMNEPYTRLRYKEENLIHPTSAGFCVRSKAEVMIAEESLICR